MNPSPRTLRPQGFTLVELLVVISIIAVLAGLAFPALNGALYQGKVTRATAQVNQIRTAINAFQTEYGTYPTYGGNSADDGQGATTQDLKWSAAADWVKLCTVLNGARNLLTTALDASAQSDNPRQINFMEFRKSDLDSSGALKDATCSTSNPFYYVLYTDSNYNNILKVDYSADGANVKLGTGATSTTFSGSVAVYSKNGNDPSKKRSAITTW